jgi:hypothetical protein
MGSFHLPFMTLRVSLIASTYSVEHDLARSIAFIVDIFLSIYVECIVFYKQEHLDDKQFSFGRLGA